MQNSFSNAAHWLYGVDNWQQTSLVRSRPFWWHLRLPVLFWADRIKHGSIGCDE
jgi:hypothetical protein